MYSVVQEVLIEKVKKLGRYYSCFLGFFGRMVKLGHLVFYLFSRLVLFLAVRFSIYSAVWIRPFGQVRF